MKVNKFTVDYESINLPNTKSRYHEIIYMYQMNPQQANFGQKYEFSQNLRNERLLMMNLMERNAFTVNYESLVFNKLTGC